MIPQKNRFMKHVSKYDRRIKIAYFRVAVITIFLAIMFFPSYTKFKYEGDNVFTVYLNGEKVGVTTQEDKIDHYLIIARKRLASNYDSMVLVGNCDLTYEGQELLWGDADNGETIVSNMTDVLRKNLTETLNRSYTVKINEYTVNLANTEEVLELLQASISNYDETGKHYVDLALDPDRELNVLTAVICSEDEEEEEDITEENVISSAGIEAALDEIFARVEPERELDFDEYDYGLKDIGFSDPVEVVEAYLLKSSLTPLDEAINNVTKDQEKEQIYEVVSGDTLSQIADKNEIPLEDLIAMNDTLDDASSMIRPGDELVITVPEPELSVSRVEEVYYEEDYEAEIIYVPNDDWYTTDQVTLQEPSAGHHRVVALVTYRNNEEVSREILKEEVDFQAVAKIVERGTKIPPTYIKPISGGRLSSTFGHRKAPRRGASSYHKGVDWSTPVGTAVMASSAGTVVKAGWASGYGYVIYINHADGKQTRYGHLSRVLVSVGQYVSQGQKIALSGNTGVSTGPHLHFEILVGGSQVNPLNIIN